MDALVNNRVDYDHSFHCLFHWACFFRNLRRKLRRLVMWYNNVKLLLFSFTIVILVVTIKLCTHTKFFSGLFIFSILITSVIPYIGYMWISNFLPSLDSIYTNYINGTAEMYWTKADTYFLTIFFCCFIFALDYAIVYIDYMRGGYASKMRQILKQ